MFRIRQIPDDSLPERHVSEKHLREVHDGRFLD